MARQHVARIFAFGNRGDDEPGRSLGRKIFQAVHGKIDIARQQRIFDFFGEQAFAADFGKRRHLQMVARGLDDPDLGRSARFFEPGGNVPRLP